MLKLKLDVDALRVESFAVGSSAAAGGTVHGRATNTPIPIFDDSTGCDGGGWASLMGTCAGCPTVGTCIGPTYCCPATWRQSCNGTCVSCPYDACGI